MRKGLSLVGVVTAVLLLGLVVLFRVTSGTGTKMTEEQKTTSVQKAVQDQQHLAKRVIESIRYVKDERTGLCFAYPYYGLPDRRPESITVVPCDSIPPELLVVVTPDSSEPEEAK